MAAQLCKRAGATTIAITSGSEKRRIATEVLGYDHCVDRIEEDLAEALAKVHDLGAKYGSDMSDSVVRKAKAHAADQREHIKRLEKEVHMLNSKGRMLEVQCDMLQQQEEQLRNSFDRILSWLGLLGAAVVIVFAVGAVWPASWAPFVGALGWKCDASCEPKIEIIKSCPA